MKRPNIAIHGIVPAAGASRRMGRPKQTLAFGSSTVTGTVVKKMLAAGADTVTVVSRADLIDHLGLPADPRVVALTNDDPDSEMIDSVRIALRYLRPDGGHQDDEDCQGGILVVPGDMPYIPLTAFERTIATFRQDPTRIVIAACAGRRGHPLLFPWRLMGAVFEIQGGLDELPRRSPQWVRTVDVPDSGVITDVDRPGDFRGGRNEKR